MTTPNSKRLERMEERDVLHANRMKNERGSQLHARQISSLAALGALVALGELWRQFGERATNRQGDESEGKGYGEETERKYTALQSGNEQVGHEKYLFYLLV